MRRVEFWYEFASTYSYPAAMRVENIASIFDVTISWQPFLLGPIFKQLGWTTSPFNLQAAKGSYMWRDLERLCEDYDLPFKRPSVFPRNGLRAARIALVASDGGWCPDFSRAVFTANFAEDRDIGQVHGTVPKITCAPSGRAWVAGSSDGLLQLRVLPPPFFPDGIAIDVIAQGPHRNDRSLDADLSRSSNCWD